jgi:hypothetical protein
MHRVLLFLIYTALSLTALMLSNAFQVDRLCEESMVCRAFQETVYSAAISFNSSVFAFRLSQQHPGILQLGLSLIHRCHQFIQFLRHVSCQEGVGNSQPVKINWIGLGQVRRDLILLGRFLVLLFK